MRHVLGRLLRGVGWGAQVRRGRVISFPDPTAGDSTWSASLLILGAGASQKVCGRRGCLLSALLSLLADYSFVDGPIYVRPFVPLLPSKSNSLSSILDKKLFKSFNFYFKRSNRELSNLLLSQTGT